MLTVSPNHPNLDEQDYLEDYGRALEPEILEKLVSLWRSTGYNIGITSLGGRPKGELYIFRCLAIALANTCHGYIIVMNEVFGLDVGVYAPDVFRDLTVQGVY